MTDKLILDWEDNKCVVGELTLGVLQTTGDGWQFEIDGKTCPMKFGNANNQLSAQLAAEQALFAIGDSINAARGAVGTAEDLANKIISFFNDILRPKYLIEYPNLRKDLARIISPSLQSSAPIHTEQKYMNQHWTSAGVPPVDWVEKAAKGLIVYFGDDQQWDDKLERWVKQETDGATISEVSSIILKHYKGEK